MCHSDLQGSFRFQCERQHNPCWLHELCRSDFRKIFEIVVPCSMILKLLQAVALTMVVECIVPRWWGEDHGFLMQNLATRYALQHCLHWLWCCAAVLCEETPLTPVLLWRGPLLHVESYCTVLLQFVFSARSAQPARTCTHFITEHYGTAAGV